MYYLYGENKCADQLRSNCASDLRLFSHMQKAGFLSTRLISCSLTEVKAVYFDDICTVNELHLLNEYDHYSYLKRSPRHCIIFGQFLWFLSNYVHSENLVRNISNAQTTGM